MLQRDSTVKWIIGGLLLFILLSAYSLLHNMTRPEIKVQLGGQFLNARVSDTTTSRAKGLSGVKALSDKEAMLFVFDNDGKWGVWMKDMNFDIDIIWLDASKKVVDTAQHVSPDTYPNSFHPKTTAKYVLEVRAGFIEQYHIGPGTIATFHGLNK